MDGDASASEVPNSGQWWGATAASASASTDVMNQLCRVCGEPAAGFHFGAFTCEGCKSFFGRTYSNLSSISECKNNGECVINKKNRTSCKACRLRKCLLVGMSKSGSRYGRRSNWFKIHCLLQEQQQQQHQQHQHQPHSQLQQQGHGLQEKGKPIGLWDGQRFHDKRHHMDIDNNNKTASPMLPVRTLPPSTLPGYTPDAAAALWAARSSLLPLQMSPHHHITPPALPPLPVPFLTPPFLHGGGFHPYSGQPPKGFLLPFVQSLPPQKHPEKVVTAASSSPSSSSSSSSSSPLRDRKEEAVLDKPDIKFRPEEESVCFEKLRNLGPVQEQPIDLSIRGNSHYKVKHRRRSSGKSSSGNSDMDDDEDDDFGSDRSSEGGISDGKVNRETVEDALEEESKHRATPLDLTTKT